MNEYNSSGVLAHAAMKADIDPKTARRYIRAGQGPQEMKPVHTWRTRADPVAGIWPVAVQWLEETPELEAKMLFEHLASEPGGQVDGRALRTFQRRVTQWRRKHGPPKEVCFPQVREPGASLQFDWTHAKELGITIAGVAYPHQLAHAVLPYSNWEWAVPCQSESVLSLKLGVQEAYWRLGGVTAQLQTDQSSTATHQLRRGKSERGFNREYLAMCRHLKVEPKTIAIRCPNQNGDVESAQGHLKRRLKQHLLLRRSRDFASAADYAGFVAKVCTGINALRRVKIAEEMLRLRALPSTRFPQAEEIPVRISCYSTARVKNCAYSVPSRLIGAVVEARVSEAEVSFHYQGEAVVLYPRSHSQEPRIDYRHVIDSLVRKPGAFARYLYREELFPRPVFRQAYDRLAAQEEGQASLRYLRLLQLAALFGEDRVATALGTVLRDGALPLAENLEPGLREVPPPRPVELAAFTPDLSSYDSLIAEVAS
ncbi:IS21 family transposase [Polaromonas sp.]|uniref:IS21 family transposase n=1 Tax=Polaromonas sp. TaxID=1869339 RepID=UPI002488285B|nr:IS21 family transposase [Polaromonas sp.]MDI1273574.1 IS21 family transposase [Polaromonas sp.]